MPRTILQLLKMISLKMKYLTLFNYLSLYLFMTTSNALISPPTNDGITAEASGNGFNITRSSEDLTVLTSYLFYQCNSSQEASLKQAVLDATAIAYAGLSMVHGLSDSQLIVDFTTQAAIEYFGPPSENANVQDQIFSRLMS